MEARVASSALPAHGGRGMQGGSPRQGADQYCQLDQTSHGQAGRKLLDRNPLQATPQTIEAGKQAFTGYCVSCHGRDGQNTGVPFAASIDPPIPLLTSPEVQSYSDGQLKRVIEVGISPSGMPGSKGILGDEEIWQIVIYIRHLPPAGSLGDPKAYGGDEYGETGGGSTDTKAH